MTELRTPAHRPTSDVRPSGLGEKALMDRVAASDQRSFAEVYERHAAVAGAVAGGLCGSLADDVVQDVFLRLWRAPERFDPERGGLRTYIVMQVRGRSIDVLRSGASRRDREDLTEAARLRGIGPELDSAVAQEIVTADLLLVLSLDQREVIVLAFYGGHTYREVARLLDRPEGTVKAQVKAGLKRLRRALADSDLARERGT